MSVNELFPTNSEAMELKGFMIFHASMLLRQSQDDAGLVTPSKVQERASATEEHWTITLGNGGATAEAGWRLGQPA